MITFSNNIKGLALLHQMEEIYGKVYTSDSLLETVLYWRINCNVVLSGLFMYITSVHCSLLKQTRDEFNNARARQALVDWYLSLFVMCKA